MIDLHEIATKWANGADPCAAWLREHGSNDVRGLLRLAPDQRPEGTLALALHLLYPASVVCLQQHGILDAAWRVVLDTCNSMTGWYRDPVQRDQVIERVLLGLARRAPLPPATARTHDLARGYLWKALRWAMLDEVQLDAKRRKREMSLDEVGRRESQAGAPTPRESDLA